MATISTTQTKIRAVQFFLITVGGVLMLYGIIRFQVVSDLNSGFRAFWSNQPEKAWEAFEREVKRDEASVPGRIGLILAGLQLGKWEEAERRWSELSAAPKESDPDKAPPEGLTVLIRWQERHPREDRQYEGELFFAQAWLSAERLLRAYRRGDPPQEQDSFLKDFHRRMERFQNFIHKKETGKRGAAPRETAETSGRWRPGYLRLENMVTNADRIPDLEHLERLVASGSRVLRDRSASELKAMLHPWLHRAVREAPDNPHARAWHLLVSAELLRRSGEDAERKEETRLALDATEALVRRLGTKPSAETRCRAWLAVASTHYEYAALEPERAEAHRAAAEAAYEHGARALREVAAGAEEAAELQALEAQARR